MTFRWPDALLTEDDTTALALLATYYGSPVFGDRAYDGALFDQWDSLGTRHADADRFTADDVIAVTFLSVDVSAPATRALLRDQADEFSSLLVELGEDRDLVEETDRHDDEWAGWRLMRALRSLPGVGPTTASKLLARKRPRLRPIWDSVVTEVTEVTEVTDTVTEQWDPVRVALRQDDRALHRRLLRLRAAAGLPEDVSALRVLDVVAWMEGKRKGFGGRGAQRT